MLPIPAGGKDLKKKRFRATANERILIHLLDYIREREEVEFSPEITQAGIAEILGTRRSHVSLALSALGEKGLVIDKLGRVENEMRRRKVYFLTHEGYARAKELKKSFLKREVNVPKDGAISKVKIKDLDEFLGESYFLIDILSCVDSEGALDLSTLTGEPSAVRVEIPPEQEVPEGQDRFVEPHIPPSVAVSFLEVRCPSCWMSFLIQASGQLAEIYTRCPGCSYSFKPFLPAPMLDEPKPTKVKKMRKELLAAGIFTIALAILLPLFIDPFFSMIIWIPCIPLSVLFIAFALEGVETFTKSEERYIIIGASILLFLMVIFIQVRFFSSPAWETYLILLLILVPFAVLLGLSKKVPSGTMQETAVVVGVSFIVLGLFAAAMPGGMVWANQLYLFFIVFGTTSLLLAYNSTDFKHFTQESICVGFGIPISISAMSWLLLLSGSLDIVSLVAASLWLLLGLLLINVRLLPRNLSKRVVEALKSTTPFSIGTFFIIFGILLLFALRYVESVIPFVVGIPVAIYGIDKPAESPRKDRVAFFVYATILTLATLYPIFFV